MWQWLHTQASHGEGWHIGDYTTKSKGGVNAIAIWDEDIWTAYCLTWVNIK